eukprot:TRINITY_DN8440_c0_g1_i1.p1 TRINITY_DN8440_c0_g1~~TRINITY_DN8440_c0_g1_i1.p1  ORF type:complete len:301 (+),score=87.57 TRINITY_DN8440_c0_g1_i1:119-904(+)
MRRTPLPLLLAVAACFAAGVGGDAPSQGSAAAAAALEGLWTLNLVTTMKGKVVSDETYDLTLMGHDEHDGSPPTTVQGTVAEKGLSLLLSPGACGEGYATITQVEEIASGDEGEDSADPADGDEDSVSDIDLDSDVDSAGGMAEDEDAADAGAVGGGGGTTSGGRLLSRFPSLCIATPTAVSSGIAEGGLPGGSGGGPFTLSLTPGRIVLTIGDPSSNDPLVWWVLDRHGSQTAPPSFMRYSPVFIAFAVFVVFQLIQDYI